MILHSSPTKLKPKPNFSPMFLSNFQSNQICALASYLQANVCLAIWMLRMNQLVLKHSSRTRRYPLEEKPLSRSAQSM
ncbi:hypothetical protein QL285_016448 [Trifolium repens]|nr:hypothetical protein QL285_016448 [Trifolium repens]